MPGPTPQSLEEIEAAAHDYGIAPGGRAMILAELDAAEFSINTGIYIVWRTLKTGEGSAGVRRDGQCCRLGPKSRCFCGHTLAEHKQLKAGNPQAPACAACGCKHFSYVPMRPEEVGMWHLPRRKGFNVHLWRAPCRCGHGHDAHDPVTFKCKECANCRVFTPNYACLGCDGRGDQHETVFETESERVLAGLPVGEAYRPLGESPYLLQQVLEGAKRTEFKGAKGAKGGGALPAPATKTPEQLLESGKISITEYHRLIALPPSPPGSDRRVSSNPFDTRLGSGRGPTGREYAQAGATVRQISLDVGGGQTVEIATNLGRPMPQPGKDFSRPWEPAPPNRPPPGSSSRKQPASRPLIEEITDQVAAATLAEESAMSMRGGGGGGGGGSGGSGGGGGIVAGYSRRGGGGLSTADRLRDLEGLRKDGFVSETEYQQKRAEILAAL